MTWINKSLQINTGSYGILSINAESDKSYNDFKFTIYSYVDCGGKHQHNHFSPSINKAIKIANVLYEFAMSRKKLKSECLLDLTQKYTTRGKLFVSIVKGELTLSIGKYEGNSYSGFLTLTKKQAKKVSGYLFFWIGEMLIGTRKEKTPAKISTVLDIRNAKNNNGDV